MKRSTIWFIAWLFVLNSCIAQPGTLDQSFGSNGIVVTGPANYGADKILLQRDGKIISLGNQRNNITNSQMYAIDGYQTSTEAIEVVRYNPNGSLDPTFGAGGRVQFISGTSIVYNYYPSATLQPDGKILISCTLLNSDSNFDFALYRLNTNGTFDSTFGTGGLAMAGYDSLNDLASGVTVLNDGKIMQCGNSTKIEGTNQFLMLARYRPDGSLDSTFGINGVKESAIQLPYTESLQLLRTGRLLLTSAYFDPLVLNDSGIVVSDYQATSNWTSLIIVKAAAEGNDSSAVVGCDRGLGSGNSPFGIIKFKPNHSIDSTFGGTGKITYKFLPSTHILNDVAIQNDGKVLALVSAFFYDTVINSPYYAEYSRVAIAAVRFLRNGNPDSSFGANGIFILDTMMVSGQYGNSMALQPDSKILILGKGSTIGQGGLVVIRLLNELNTGILNFSKENENTMIYPNPVSKQAILKYELANDELISISLYDVAGRKVQTINGGEYLQAGIHSQAINIDETIYPGNYIVRLENSTRSYSGIQIVVR